MSLLDIFSNSGNEDSAQNSEPGPLDMLLNSVSSSVADAADRFINPPAQNSGPAPDLNRAASQPVYSSVARATFGVSPVLLIGGGALLILLLRKKI